MANYDSYKSYIKQKKTHKTNDMFSYKKWLTENGKAPRNDYLESLSKANSDALRATPSYGAMAEGLANSGLEKSGYKQYISDTTVGNYNDSLQNAENKLIDDLASTKSEYEDYVSDFKQKQGEIATRVTEKLMRMDLSDKSGMLAYAMNAGLSPHYAEEAVNIAYDSAVSTKKSAVLKAITELAYGKDDAYAYAKRLGLPEDISAELSEYAEVVRIKRSSENNLKNLK